MNETSLVSLMVGW